MSPDQEQGDAAVLRASCLQREPLEPSEDMDRDLRRRRGLGRCAIEMETT